MLNLRLYTHFLMGMDVWGDCLLLSCYVTRAFCANLFSIYQTSLNCIGQNIITTFRGFVMKVIGKHGLNFFYEVSLRWRKKRPILLEILSNSEKNIATSFQSISLVQPEMLISYSNTYIRDQSLLSIVWLK